MSLTSNLTDQLKRSLGLDQQRKRANERSFDVAQAREKAYESVDRGVREVPLHAIKGSVGRYQDFDVHFRMNDNVAGGDRYTSVYQAMAAGKNLGSVALYQIKDDFFVLDGHHRINAARELGREIVQAKIVELLPSKESLENRLYLERIEFRDRFGLLEAIHLTLPGQFFTLAEQIADHKVHLENEDKREVSEQEAGRDWYRTIYSPLVAIIRNSNLAANFAGRTEDDLYLYISTHQWQEGKKRNYGIGIDRLIPNDMEAFRKKMSEKQQAEYPEMQRRVTFFILMNVDGRQERKILEKLMALPEVQEAHSIHGSVDILAKVVIQRDLLSSDAEQIAQFTHSQIRMIRGVHSTQTLIPGISREKKLQEKKA